MGDERATARAIVPLPRCPFCHEDVARGEAASVCIQCHALHHADCLRESGRCAACSATSNVSPGKAPARARGTWPRVALGALVFLAIAIASWAAIPSTKPSSLATESKPPPSLHSPEGVLARFLALSPSERRASSLATPLCRALLDLEAGVKVPRGVEILRSARPLLASGEKRLYSLVEVQDGWLVDDVLALDETPVPGARVRLPAGLARDGSGDSFSAGAVAASFALEIRPLPLAKSLEADSIKTSSGTVLQRSLDLGKVGDHPAASFSGGDEAESAAVAYVDLEPGTLRYELRGPGGSRAALEQIFRASLATLRPLPPSLTDPVETLPALATRRLSEIAYEVDTPGGVEPGLPNGPELVTVRVLSLRGPKERGELEVAYHPGGTVLAQYDDPKETLPHRAFCVLGRGPGDARNADAERFVFQASGVVEGRMVVLQAEVSIERAAWRQVWRRVRAIADSFRPLRASEQWPKPQETRVLVDGVASLCPPAGWKFELEPASGSTFAPFLRDEWADGTTSVYTWSGFEGDALEAQIVPARNGMLPGRFGPIVIVNLTEGLKLVLRARARDPGRLDSVIDVLEACRATVKQP